jgi:hypothetical protein
MGYVFHIAVVRKSKLSNRNQLLIVVVGLQRFVPGQALRVRLMMGLHEIHRHFFNFVKKNNWVFCSGFFSWIDCFYPVKHRYKYCGVAYFCFVTNATKRKAGNFPPKALAIERPSRFYQLTEVLQSKVLSLECSNQIRTAYFPKCVLSAFQIVSGLSLKLS